MVRRAQPSPNSVLLLEKRLERQRAQIHPNSSVNDFFLISSIDTVLRSYNLSYRQIEEGITDGAHDGGIDAVYTFLNGRLIDDDRQKVPNEAHINIEIVQAKNEKGFREDALQKLYYSLPLLLDINSPSGLTDEFNDRILERFEIFRSMYKKCGFPPLSINVRYVTKSADPVNGKVLKKANRLKDELSGLFADCSSRIDFLGAERLNFLARKRRSSPIELQASEKPLSGEMGGFICLVGLQDWYKFISDDEGILREYMFEENVRGFAGDTRINKDIIASLEQRGPDSPDFWWLNNGVTVLGRRVRASYNNIKIEDPQIVNGLQTSTCIYQYFRKSSFDAELQDTKRKLLVRVVEIKEEEKDLSTRIIKATNSQNRVNSASLRAIDPLQRDIEEAFEQWGYYYERRKNFYKNANKPRDRIIELLEVAQAMAAIVLRIPHISRGQPSTLVQDKYYKEIFNSKTHFLAHLNAVLIVRQIDKYLAQTKGLNRQDRSNIKFQLARAATAFALSSASPKAIDISYLEPSEFTTARLDPIYEWTLERRNRAAEHEKSSDSNILAKSDKWTSQINKDLNYHSKKNRWPPHITSLWNNRQ